MKVTFVYEMDQFKRYNMVAILNNNQLPDFALRQPLCAEAIIIFGKRKIMFSFVNNSMSKIIQ